MLLSRLLLKLSSVCSELSITFQFIFLLPFIIVQWQKLFFSAKILRFSFRFFWHCSIEWCSKCTKAWEMNRRGSESKQTNKQTEKKERKKVEGGRKMWLWFSANSFSSPRRFDTKGKLLVSSPKLNCFEIWIYAKMSRKSSGANKSVSGGRKQKLSCFSGDKWVVKIYVVLVWMGKRNDNEISRSERDFPHHKIKKIAWKICVLRNFKSLLKNQRWEEKMRRFMRPISYL